jgi:hypothetical protein
MLQWNCARLVVNIFECFQDGERRFGAGYGCGGLSSGLALDAVPSDAVLPYALAGSDPSRAASPLAAFPGAREYVVRLHQEHSVVTADSMCPATERARRAAVKSTFIVAEVK